MSPTVLIADDDEASARFLSQLLIKEGYRVQVVADSRAALALCAADPPDLVVIDLVEPQGHGFDVCRTLNAVPATG